MGEQELVVKSKSRDATRQRQRSSKGKEEVEEVEDEIYVALTQEDQEAMQAPANLVPWGQNSELRDAESSFSAPNVINKAQEKSLEALLDQQVEEEKARIMAREREYQESLKVSRQGEPLEAEIESILKGVILVGGVIAGYFLVKWLFASSPKPAAVAAPTAQTSSKAAAALSSVLSEVSP